MRNKIGKGNDFFATYLSFPPRLTKEGNPAEEIQPDFLLTFELLAIRPTTYDIP